jgi:16S rRNA (cytidine1402-2'-O)-methyltransferase
VGGSESVRLSAKTPSSASTIRAATHKAALTRALTTLSVKDAAREVAAQLDLPRREVYARALELTRK